MIHTFLTDSWGLRYPIIGAPMAGAADAVLAAAVSRAGGLGMIGMSSQARPDFLLQQAAIARTAGPFGIGLMIWALDERPDLFEAALTARPMLLSLSFGDPTPMSLVAMRPASEWPLKSIAATKQSKPKRPGLTSLWLKVAKRAVIPAPWPRCPDAIVLDAVTVPVVAAGGIASPAESAVSSRREPPGPGLAPPC